MSYTDKLCLRKYTDTLGLKFRDPLLPASRVLELKVSTTRSAFFFPFGDKVSCTVGWPHIHCVVKHD